MRCIDNSVQIRLVFQCGMDLQNLFCLHRTGQIERIVRCPESSQQCINTRNGICLELRYYKANSAHLVANEPADTTGVR
ncbi:hypothetical protein D3C87_1984320 [compost metagenome]